MFLYPHRREDLKEVVYWMFGELFDEDEEDCDLDAIKIVNAFFKNVYKSRTVFFCNIGKEPRDNSTIVSGSEDMGHPARTPSNNTFSSSQKSLSTNISKLYNDQVDMIPANSLSQCQ